MDGVFPFVFPFVTSRLLVTCRLLCDFALTAAPPHVVVAAVVAVVVATLLILSQNGYGSEWVRTSTRMEVGGSGAHFG